MSTPFRKQSYTRASADHRDFGGFLNDMERALRLLGIYCVYDPDTNGSDMYGIIFQQGPIDPRKLWAWLRKQNPENYEGSRFNKEVVASLTPSSLYTVGDQVKATHMNRRRVYTILGANYYPKWGWCYLLPDKESPGGEIEVEEKYLIASSKDNT